MAASGALKTHAVFASGWGLVRISYGMTALEIALLPSAPPALGALSVRWESVLKGNITPLFSQVALKANSRPANGGVAQGAPANAIGLATVLRMVKDTSGSPIDAYAALMESGLDSLGTVELRNKLQAVAGEESELPNTLIFEAPTARQLAIMLADMAEAVLANEIVVTIHIRASQRRFTSALPMGSCTRESVIQAGMSECQPVVATLPARSRRGVGMCSRCSSGSATLEKQCVLV